MKLQRLIGLALGTLSVWLVLTHPARASTFSLTCGDARFAGEIVIAGEATIGSRFGGETTRSFSIPVTLSNAYSASTKCDIIAAIINKSNPFPNDFNGGLSATAVGNVLTIQTKSPSIDKSVSIDVVGVRSDTTGEFNQLSVNLFPGEQAAYLQFFTLNENADPPPGTTFSVFATNDGVFGVTTFALSGPTPTTAANLLDSIDSQFAARGLPFDLPIIDPTTGQTIGEKTRLFDPATVTIGWEGNTALYLANFGIEVIPATVPEPATLALLGIGLAGLGFSRRQRK